MVVQLDPVMPMGTLPARTDVVVIGGGIIGVSTALSLAERGISVVLCEKGIIGGEQSSRNWGWCRSMGRDPRELPLMLESLRQWRGLDARIKAETGFRQCGTLYACPDNSIYAERASWLPHAHEHGLDTRMLHGAEVGALTGGIGEKWAGALHTPSDGVAEPALVTPAIARAARRAGGVILQGCAVRGLDIAGGVVAGVVTEHGRVACERVVLAGGVWSGLFCRSLGIRLPQLGVRATVQRTEPTNEGPGLAIWGPGLAVRKRRDGGFTIASGHTLAELTPDSFRYFRDFLPMLRSEWRDISLRVGLPFLDAWRLSRPWGLDDFSPFERVRILDPAPSRRDLHRTRATLDRTFPTLGAVRTVAGWAGMIDTTPDALPVISEIAALPGLVLSTGYSGHGFGIGPGAGRLTADIATGDAPVVDPAPFEFSRLSASGAIHVG